MQETSCALKIFTPSLAKSAITLPCQIRKGQTGELLEKMTGQGKLTLPESEHR